jgi:four helix bundle protein
MDKQVQYRDVENLKVYTKLCDLHIEVWNMTETWPRTERFELTSQVLRSSNSSPAQLAEKNDDRHVKNRIEGVNRARGEAGETIHHLYIASCKGYVSSETYINLKTRYRECIRLLNGLEKNLEKTLPQSSQKWVQEPTDPYATVLQTGYPEATPPDL